MILPVPTSPRSRGGTPRPSSEKRGLWFWSAQKFSRVRLEAREAPVI